MTAPGEPSAAAFVRLGPADCTSKGGTYQLRVPPEWWYDIECRFVHAGMFEADLHDADRVTAIRIVLVPNDIGTFDDVVSTRKGEVDGRPATLWELIVTGDGGVYPSGTRIFEYVVQLGPTVEAGPNLLVVTDSHNAPDYEKAKVATQEIVSSMRFR